MKKEQYLTAQEQFRNEPNKETYNQLLIQINQLVDIILYKDLTKDKNFHLYGYAREDLKAKVADILIEKYVADKSLSISSPYSYIRRIIASVLYGSNKTIETDKLIIFDTELTKNRPSLKNERNHIDSETRQKIDIIIDTTIKAILIEHKQENKFDDYRSLIDELIIRKQDYHKILYKFIGKGRREEKELFIKIMNILQSSLKQELNL